jgi:hypothetical protein
MLKQTIFKALIRLGIEPTKRLGANNRGQVVSYITQQQARIVIETIRCGQESARNQESPKVTDVLLNERGVFYLLLLEPTHDPGRFKLGFAASLPERLRQLRCSAPFANVIATWPCKRLWERTAIECVTIGCERIHTEVFRAASLTPVHERCEQFFALMPTLSASAEKMEFISQAALETKAHAL